MAELTDEQRKKIVEELLESQKKLEQEKFPIFTKEEVALAKELLDQMKEQGKALDEIANKNEVLKKLQENIKQDYNEQYLYLTESEKQLEAAMRTRLAQQAQLEADLLTAIEDRVKLEATQEEYNEEIERALERRKQILGEEFEQLKSLSDIQAEQLDTTQTIKDIELNIKKAKADTANFSQAEIDSMQDSLKLEKAKLLVLEDAAGATKVTDDLTEKLLKTSQELEAVRRGESDISNDVEGMRVLVDLDEKRAKFARDHGSAIQNSITKITGLKDSTGGLLDTLIKAADEDARAADGANRKGAAVQKFKDGLEKAFTPANLLANTIGFIANKLNEAEEAFKKSFMGAKSLATTLVETDIAFVKETGQARELGETLEDLKFEATDLGFLTTELDQGFRGLTASFGRFATLNKSTQKELAVSAASFERLGVKTDVFGGIIQQLNVGFGQTPKQAVAAADDIRKFSQAVGLGAEGLTKFNQNIDLLVAFGGERGTKVFKDLAIEAKRAGVEISALREIGKTFDTFEGAMQAAGKLNFILKGPYLNSMKLLRADDAERIQMLKDSLQASGTTFESLGRRGQEALAATLGKGVAEVQRIFRDEDAATAEANKKNIMERARAMGGLDEEMKKQLTLQQKQELAAEAMVTAFQPLAELIHGISSAFADLKIIFAPLATIFGGFTTVLKGLIPVFTMIMGAKGLKGMFGIVKDLIPTLKAGQGAALGMTGAFGRLAIGAAGAAAGILGVMSANDAYEKAKERGESGAKEIGMGALSGASAGAMIGSVIPGVGTLIGAGIGGIVGAIGTTLNEGVTNFKPIGGQDVGLAILGDAPGGLSTNVTETAALPTGTNVLNARDTANLTSAVQGLPPIIDNLNTATSKLVEMATGASTPASEPAAPAPPREQIMTQPLLITLEIDKQPIARVSREISVDVVNKAFEIRGN